MRVVTLAGDADREATLASWLGQRSDLTLVLRCVDRVETLATIRGGSLDAVIAVGDPQWFDRQAASEVAANGIRLVALVGHPFEAERWRGWGAEVLEPDAALDEIAAACTSSKVPERRERSRTTNGRVTAVWGPKGCPGRTTVAIELAMEIFAHERSTLLIDADAYGGDILQLLGITEEIPSIIWAARMAAKGELDEERFGDDLRRTDSSGPILLPGIPRADLWPEISEFGWQELISASRSTFTHSVFDVGFCLEPDATPYSEKGEGRNRIARTTIRESDRVVAVVRADPVGIKNFLWAFDDLRELVETERVVIVVNRVLPGDEREISELLRRYLQAKPIAFIPEARSSFADAVAKGRSVRHSRGAGDVVGAIRSVAEVVGVRPAPSGLLAKLGGRS